MGTPLSTPPLCPKPLCTLPFCFLTGSQVLPAWNPGPLQLKGKQVYNNVSEKGKKKQVSQEILQCQLWAREVEKGSVWWSRALEPSPKQLGASTSQKRPQDKHGSW